MRVKYLKAKHLCQILEREAQESKNENGRLREDIANLETQLQQSQKSLESISGGDKQKRNMESFQEFDKVMCYLESSLKFVPPANGENTIQSRLLTIIGYLAEKEEKSAKLAAANDQLKIQLDKMSASIINKPREPAEATLTRVMQQHEVDMAKLQGELDAARNQLILRETAWRNTNEELDQRAAKMREERNAAEANLNEARAQMEDLSKALNRAEKGKSAMILSRDHKAEELEALQRKYDELLRSSKDKQVVEDGLRRDLEEQRRLYDKAKTRSLVADIEKIKSLTQRVQIAESQLQKSRQTIEEKDSSVAAYKAKATKLQEEKSEELKRLGRLQEELAAKDLMLANARSTSAGFESTAKLAERERDAALQRAKLEVNVWKTKMTVANNAANELQNECDFLRASVAALETRAAEQMARIQQGLDAVRQKDNYIASLQSKLAVAEGRVLGLEQIQASYIKLMEDYHQKLRTQKEELEPLRIKVENAESIDTSQLRNLNDLRDRFNKLYSNTIGISSGVPSSQEVEVKTEDPTCAPNGSQIYEELVRMNIKLIETVESNNRQQRNSNRRSFGSVDGNDGPTTRNRRRETENIEMQQEIENMTNEISRLHQERESLQSEIDNLKTLMNQQHTNDNNGTDVEVDAKATEEKEELSLDLARALARISSLEELVSSLEEEVIQLKRVHDDMVAVEEEMKGEIQAMHSEMSWKDDKMARLEKDLNNRKHDLTNKMEELVEAKSKLQEQTSRANTLEEERQGLKHQVAMLEKLKAEQQEQLDGRERALKRLDDARKTYEKMYESKIETLKEERVVTEKVALAEASRIQTKYEQEMQEAVKEWTEKLSQADLNHDSTLETLKSDKLALEQERNSLIIKTSKLEESLQRAMKNVEERNLLLSGYMALVSEKEEGGMLQEGAEVLQNLLEQRQQDMDTITGLTEEIQKLRVVMDNQYKLMERYDQDMTSLANRNELFIRQGRDREQELISERKARFMEQAQLKALLSAKDETINSLEEELNELGRPRKRKEMSAPRDSPAPTPTTTTTTIVPTILPTPETAIASNTVAPPNVTTTSENVTDNTTTSTTGPYTKVPRASSTASDDMDLGP
ncbi:hypothetical protein BGZ79_009737 [Entomortierella chlamydospora]|nr:hypothetical protein BGZ79_009737 [Entomortierella chlamydospora]